MALGRVVRGYSKVGLLAGLVFTGACDGRSSVSLEGAADPIGTTASALAAGAASFATTAMPGARGQHATVLLPSGKLLVVGGVNQTGFAASAALFDPSLGTWSAAGSVTAGNITQALLLPNGKVLALTDGSAAAQLYDPATNAWSAAGTMAKIRALTTLTLLQNGKVLVAGGSADNGVRLATAELYDPATNAFTATGSMAAGRGAHVASLLPSGKVLVVSGFNTSGEVATAELYDPTTEIWSAAAPPLVPRHYAASTVLPDGRVLLSGGFTTAGAITQCELYDPAANTWTATGSLGYVRSGHTTTMLPSGRVVATGGSAFRAAAQSVIEVYDPATGTWSSAGSLTTGRENHTATLLPSGKIFIAGGFTEAPSITFYATTELYDPAVNGWSSAGALAAPRGRAVGTLLPSGKVLVAGGRNAGNTTVASAELYDASTNTWSSAGALATARERATATLLASGKVLVAGGTSGAGTTSFATTELYDPTANTWAAGPALMSARHLHSATLLGDGKVLVAGGLLNATTQASAELYDPTAGTWTTTGSAATPRSDHAAVRLSDGRVLVAGGRSSAGAALASAEIYTPATGTWQAASPLTQARQSLRLTLLPSGRVLASGGVSGTTAVTSTEVFDPVTNAWSTTSAIGTARWSHTASLLPTGEVLIAGGSNAGGNAAGAEVYDPTLGAWRAVADPSASGEAVATTLPGGLVLLAGGAATAQLYDGTRAPSSIRPVVTKAERLYPGCVGTVEGQRFRGIGGGSMGGYEDSPTDYPLVRLQTPQSGRLWALPTVGWSAGTASIELPNDVAPGTYSLSVLVNAAGGGRMVNVATNVAPVAADQTVAGTMDTVLPIIVTASDTEADQTLTFAVVTPPAHGTLSGTLPSVSYTPDAGYVGADSFTFKARDCGKDSNVATVAITVVDPSPTIQCPADVTIEATSASGATGAWPDAVATDQGSTPPVVTYAPARGSDFPLGSTTVTATAEDINGGTGSCVFQVLVKDTTAPTLTCPADKTLRAASNDGAVVNFDLPSPTDAVSTPSVTSSPASGSVFPVGTTNVTITAKDGAGNTSTCSFAVVVEPPASSSSPSSGDASVNSPASDDPSIDSPESSDGCGCHLAGSPTSWRASSAGALAIALTVVGALRRRRRTPPVEARR